MAQWYRSHLTTQEIGLDAWVRKISPGEGNGNPLQYFCMENSMDRGAWQSEVHGIERVGHDGMTKHELLGAPAVMWITCLWRSRES